MKNEIKNLNDALEWFGNLTFKLEHIIEGIVTYKSCIPYQHEDYWFYIEVDIFYDGGDCLSYDTLIDIVRTNEKVFEVKIWGIGSQLEESLFIITFDKYEE